MNTTDINNPSAETPQSPINGIGTLCLILSVPFLLLESRQNDELILFEAITVLVFTWLLTMRVKGAFSIIYISALGMLVWADLTAEGTNEFSTDTTVGVVVLLTGICWKALFHYATRYSVRMYYVSLSLFLLAMLVVLMGSVIGIISTVICFTAIYAMFLCMSILVQLMQESLFMRAMRFVVMASLAWTMVLMIFYVFRDMSDSEHISQYIDLTVETFICVGSVWLLMLLASFFGPSLTTKSDSKVKPAALGYSFISLAFVTFILDQYLNSVILPTSPFVRGAEGVYNQIPFLFLELHLQFLLVFIAVMAKRFYGIFGVCLLCAYFLIFALLRSGVNLHLLASLSLLVVIAAIIGENLYVNLGRGLANKNE